MQKADGTFWERPSFAIWLFPKVLNIAGGSKKGVARVDRRMMSAANDADVHQLVFKLVAVAQGLVAHLGAVVVDGLDRIA